MDDRLDEKYSRILEGMFRGITAKIKEAQASMEKEFRYGVSQQGFSHDALSNEMKEEAAKLLTEIKYLAQQNIDIYDYSRKEHAAMQESLLRAMDERNAMLLKAIDEKLASPVPVPAEVDYDLLAEKVAAILRQEPAEAEVPEEEEGTPQEELVPETMEAEGAEPSEPAEAEPSELAEVLNESTAEEETAVADASAAETPADFDDSGFMYDILAEKIASILPEPDYDIIADKVAASLPDFDADLIAQKVAEAIHTDPEALAGELAEAIPPVDYELISEKVAGSLAERAVGEDTAETIARRVAELLKGEGIRLDVADEAAPADTVEEPAPEELTPVAPPMPEPVVEPEPVIEPEPQPEPQPEPKPEPEPEPVVEPEPEPIVEPEPVVEPQPQPVTEPIPVAPQPAPMAGYMPVPPMPQAVPFYVPVPVPMPTPVVQPMPVAQPEPAPAPAPVAPVAPIVPEPEDESKTVRYKRSFVAKIIGSEEDVKTYYSDLKNAILSYGKVRSQINWTNDRFSIGNDSVIKIGVRGRTLVVYLALDPKEFPETVYHQKFAGDTKMYEMTPMMVKVKTKAAVKKTIRLIDLCMERNGAVKEEREPVDYAAQYFFRTDEELLAEGLIKTAIVDKSDMDF